MMNGFLRQIGLIIAFLFLTGISYAQTDSCESFYTKTIKSSEFDGSWAFSAILSQAPTGCILGKNDNTGLALMISSIYAKPKPGRVAIRANLIKIFDTVIANLRAINSGVCSAVNQTACVLDKQIAAILRLNTDLDSIYVSKNQRTLLSNTWVVKRHGVQLATGDNILKYVENQCAGGLSSNDCKLGVLVSAKIIRSSLIMQNVVTQYQLPIIGENKKFLSNNEKEWDEYFNEVSVQYPWELALNSYRFTSIKSPEELAKLPRAPDSKYILMHPSVGYEYIKSTGKKSDLEAAVLLELFGYERWKWINGKAKDRWGASVALSFADIQGMDNVGYGLVLHTPIRNTSISVIYRDGDNGSETGVFVNIDLAKLFMQYKDKDLSDFLKR